MSKKRKEAPQPTTLLSFFGSASTPLNAKERTFRKNTARKKIKREVQETIIVLDSDEDEELCRRVESAKEEDSSDVEIIGLVTPKPEGRSAIRTPGPGLARKDMNTIDMLDSAALARVSKPAAVHSVVDRGAEATRAESPCPSENVFSPSPPLLSNRRSVL